MDAFALILFVIVGLLAFDFSALRWGSDSRESLPDDHIR
jgi:hypothetical protein